MQTLKERQEAIEWLIPDENTRHIVFCYDDMDKDSFLSDESMYISYFSNMMVFSALTVWNIFLAWKRNIKQKEINGNNSFWRIYNMLDKTCDPTKNNGEFIDDLLLNLEIDSLMGHEDEKESFTTIIGITELFKFNDQLSKYIYFAKQSRLSSRTITQFGYDDFYNSITIFSFLRDIKLEFYPSGIICNNEPVDNFYRITANLSRVCSGFVDKLDYQYTLFTSKGFSTYYIEDFQALDERHFDADGHKKQTVKINYVEMGGTGRISVLVMNEKLWDLENQYFIINDAAVENFFLSCDIINVLQNNIEDSFFRDYILLNNKYLKNLAYTISDALPTRLRNIIKTTYNDKYKEIFDQMHVKSLYTNKDISGYRWDEIILFLFLEEGVYEFLKFLFKNGLAYDDCKSSFIRRFGKGAIRKILVENKYIDHPEFMLSSGASENEKNACRAKSLVSLATKLLLDSKFKMEKSTYPETIDHIIEECKRVNRLSFQHDRIQNKVNYFLQLTLYTVTFIAKFYSSILQYAASKYSALFRLNLDDIQSEDYLKYKEEKMQWLREIRDTASKFAINHQINTVENDVYNTDELLNRIKMVFDILIKINDDYSKYHNAKNEILFDTLGKQTLFDSVTMGNYYTKIDNAVNKYKKNTSNEADVYSTLLDYLMYLKTGYTEKVRESVKSWPIENSIYPVVGQYYSGITSVDGYKYALFNISTKDIDGHDVVIRTKMITDDEFDFGCSYYCIPNINRIANIRREQQFQKIWVSPIIIPCSTYLPQAMTNMIQLNDEKDFEQAIELIYQSDMIVYSKLFGSLENAKKVFPYLFENRKSKFYKDHYYIYKENDQVVAIASLCDFSDFSWNIDVIQSAFEQAMVQFPDTYKEAMDIFAYIYNDYPGSMYYHVDDVCVLEDNRYQGIGTSIMMYMMKLAETQGKSIRLSVYADNTIAKNMYASLGFVPVFCGAEACDSLKPVKYIKMVKI